MTILGERPKPEVLSEQLRQSSEVLSVPFAIPETVAALRHIFKR